MTGGASLRLTNAEYIAGTDDLTYADTAAFGQVACATENDIDELIPASDTPAIQAWFDRMVAAMRERCEPTMVPWTTRLYEGIVIE